jgi:predicted NBD/HSP70 family sugar kinase
MTNYKNWAGKLVGFELCPNAVIAVAIEPDGKVFDSATSAFERGTNAFGPLAENLRELTANSPGVETIGLALPGLIDRKAGRVAHSSLVKLDNGVGLAEALKAETGVSVVLENDANAAAIAEHLVGAGQSANNLFYITLGEGIGGAVIINNEVFRGDSGFAGEFGNIAINSEGMRLEDIASAVNIVRRTRNRIHQDSTSSLSRLSESEITIEAIVKAANAEDDFAMMMLERTGTYVGTAVAAVVNMLNIERVVIGGEVMRAGNVVLDAITERAREFSYTPSFKGTSIVAGDLGQLASAIGAALTAENSR